MKLFYLVVICFCINRGSAQSILFQQDFSSSNTVSTYVNSTAPSGAQFTYTFDSGTNVLSINSISGNNKLVMNRATTSGSMRYVRNLDFSSVKSLYAQFTFSANSTAASKGSTPASFYIGYGFTNNSVLPLDPNTFVELGFDYPLIGTPNTFRLRNKSAGTASSDFTGQKTITIVCNDTGNNLRYVNPNGGGNTVLATNKSDVWVDNQLIFSGMGSTIASTVGSGQSTNSLKNFAFHWESSQSNPGQFTFDDFLIRDVSGILPITIGDFKAESTDNKQVELSWKQFAPSPQSHYEIGRSQDAINYEQIAWIESTEKTEYSFKDLQAKQGYNYYKINQVDQNGLVHEYRPIAIKLLFC